MIPIIGYLGSLPIYVFGSLLSIALIASYLRFQKDKTNNKYLPTVLLFLSIILLGCHLSGDGTYGPLTQSFLGMSFVTGTVPTAPGLKAYPFAMWLSLICAIALAVLVKRYDN